MENVIEMPMPMEIDAEVVEKPAEPVVEPAAEAEDMPYTHVRAPEIHRAGTRILMALAGICGAVAGAVTVFAGAEIPSVPAGEFGGVFLGRLGIGAAMLGIEFLLGFFALGDWLVWSVPLLCGMSSALRLCATQTELSAGSWVVLIGAAFTMIGTVFGAARSADFSALLLKLSRGGTVYMESSPRQSYAVSFLGYAALILAGALAEGISTLI